MKIEDTFTVDAPVERVWRMITDPGIVGPCIPGCQGIEVTGPDTYQADIKVAAVTYASDVSVFGRLGKFGLGIMKKKARDIGREFADTFRGKVEGTADG